MDENASYGEWIVKQTFIKRLSAKNFFSVNEQREIAELISEGRSLRSIWFLFKERGRMVITYPAFTVWCKKFNKFLKIGKNVNSNVSPTPTQSFTLDLPIESSPTEKPQTNASVASLFGRNLSHLSDEEYVEYWRKESKKLDKQGVEGVFVIDRSEKF